MKERKWILIALVCMALVAPLGCAHNPEKDAYLPAPGEKVITVLPGSHEDPPTDFDIVAYGHEYKGEGVCPDHVPTVISNVSIRIPLTQLYNAAEKACKTETGVNKVSVLHIVKGNLPYIPAE